MTGLLAVLLPLFGFLNGYISSIFFKFFKGSAWMRMTLFTALAYPVFLSIMYGVILICDISVGAELLGGSGLSLVTIFYLFFLINLPSTALGAFSGFVSDDMKTPVKANRVRRLLPEQPTYLKNKLLMLALGFLLSILIEPQFLRLQQSISSHAKDQDPFWETQADTRSPFGRTLDLIQIVLFLMGLVESSLLHTYVQLCHEDYNWWWNALLMGSCPSFFLLLDATLRLLFQGHALRTLMALAAVNIVIASGLALVGAAISFIAAFKYN